MAVLAFQASGIEVVVRGFNNNLTDKSQRLLCENGMCTETQRHTIAELSATITGINT